MSIFQEDLRLEQQLPYEYESDRQSFFQMCQEFEKTEVAELAAAFEKLLSRLEEIHQKYASDHSRENTNIRSYTYNFFLRQIRPLLYRPGRKREADPKKEAFERVFFQNYERVYALGQRSIVNGVVLSNVPQEAWAQIIQLEPEEERIQKQWNMEEFYIWLDERKKDNRPLSEQDVIQIANILGRGVLPSVFAYRRQTRAVFWGQEAKPPDEVDQTMRHILARLNAALSEKDIDNTCGARRLRRWNFVSLEAARAYVDVINTHPIPDGNGRTAAGLLVLFMEMAGFQTARVRSTRWNIPRLCRYNPIALAYLAVVRSKWEIVSYSRFIQDYFHHLFGVDNNTSDL